MSSQNEIAEAIEADRETNTESEENLCLEEEDDCFFQDIDMLLEKGIPASDIIKLKRAGIYTIKGLQMTLRKNLLEINGFDDQKIDGIREACSSVSVACDFVTALEVRDQRKQIFKLSTGSNNLK